MRRRPATAARGGDPRAGQRRHPDDLGIADDEVAELTEIFSALGDPTRVKIIYSILEHERSVGEIATHLQLSEPSVSQHLRRLRALRVVRLRKAGRHHYYRLDDEHIVTLLGVCLAHLRDAD